MPGEEMEITTDFGHTGFENDSDIDLDFAVGQADEDLELADFDHAQEMQNFNSDTRDELMAEGDDASYGMIDADDIQHIDITTTANDIEIDLGDTGESLWHHGVSHGVGTFENAAEIDYADNVDIGNTNTENAGSGEGSWLGTSYTTGNPDETEAELQATTVDTPAGNLLQDGTVHIDGIAAQDFGLPENKGNNIEIVPTDDNNGLEVVAQTGFDGQQNTAPNDATQPTEDVTASEQDDHGVDNGVEADVLTGQPGIAYETHEDTQRLASHHDVSETGYDHGDDAIDYEEDPSASVTSDHRSAEEHFIEEQDQADQNDLTNLQAFEHQLGGDSYAEPTNDHESVDQALGEEGDPTPATGKVGSRSPAEKSHSENQEGIDDDGENGENQAPTSPAHVEHPLSIATRHEMFITYGQTDYRLFAKSDHDDPNQYFLSDMSALELPLGEFLSSLREVIADEVSPLDELVMHVDGLGLEFSQSSASDMLEEFTFGDILSLYDRLVKNDGEESPTPDLCTHLMVRPNCRQRLMALLDSASLGRGLSEMAVYRERTPAPGEQADDSESEDSYDPPQLEGGEEDYGYDENEHADGEVDEHGAEDAENDVGSYSPSVHTPAVTGTKTDEPANEAEKSGDYIEENASTNNDAATVDGPIDYSDDEDELDLSLKQGKPSYFSHLDPCNQSSNCQCEVCYELRLDRLGMGWQSETWKSSSNSTGTQQYTCEPSQGQGGAGNLATPLTKQHFVVPDYSVSGNLKPAANYQIQDQQPNASSENNLRKDQEQSGIVAADEHGYSNQHTPPANESADAHNSDITSASATLNGDDKDEIDYSDDDDDFTTGNNDPSFDDSGAQTASNAPIDDEITWESENEDAENELTKAPKETVQVSPSSGKRPRSESDLPEGEAERHDVKRRRPS
ncbi:hypothetical protein F5Y04DRAFT_42646 [Hypomontagnella monticulosa]|nr:hypothetical protein F5Y04DRAFT_42646 [Hypomontagnella monticulosa]